MPGRLQTLSVGCLIAQNAAHSMVMRYSKGIYKEKYDIKVCMMMAEVLKLVISMVMILLQGHNICLEGDGKKITQLSFGNHLRALVRSSLPLSIPAVLYLVQNVIGFESLRYLDASTYGILGQGKILTAAIFSVLWLGRTIARVQWIALLFLVVGCILVQDPPTGGKKLSTIDQEKLNNKAYAVILVLIQITISGLVGIYLEKVLKNLNTSVTGATSASKPVAPAPVSLWERNFQLSFYGILFALFSVFAEDFDMTAVSLTNKASTMFHDFTPLAWVIACTGGLGGILVAMVVKFTDTIQKGFACSVAIIINMALQAVFLDFVVTPYYLLGSTISISAIFAYNKFDASATKTSPAAIVSTIELQAQSQSCVVEDNKSDEEKGLLSEESVRSRNKSNPFSKTS